MGNSECRFRRTIFQSQTQQPHSGHQSHHWADRLPNAETEKCCHQTKVCPDTDRSTCPGYLLSYWLGHFLSDSLCCEENKKRKLRLRKHTKDSRYQAYSNILHKIGLHGNVGQELPCVQSERKTLIPKMNFDIHFFFNPLQLQALKILKQEL